jgi:hypothetical protein
MTTNQRSHRARARSVSAAVGIVGGLLIVAGIGYAAIPSPDGVIYGCYSNAKGIFRIAEPGTCTAQETQISWNQKGPQGPIGSTGPQGPQGPPGPQGAQGPAGIGARTYFGMQNAALIATAPSWVDVPGVTAPFFTDGDATVDLIASGVVASSINQDCGFRFTVDGVPITDSELADHAVKPASHMESFTVQNRGNVVGSGAHAVQLQIKAIGSCSLPNNPSQAARLVAMVQPPLNECDPNRSPPAGATAQVVASNVEQPMRIAVDGQSVYWVTTKTSIEKCPLGGCAGSAPTVLALGPSGGINDLALSGTTLFYTTNGAGTLNRCTTSCNNDATIVAEGMQWPTTLVLDRGTLFWNTATTAMWTCSESGCGSDGPDLFASGNYNVSQFSVDGARVYWREGGNIISCPRGGCGGSPPTVLANDGRETWGGMAASVDEIFYSTWNGGEIRACAKNGCGTGRVFAPNAAGSLPTSIAIDACNVYWTDSGRGEVRSCPKSGCVAGSLRVIASGLTSASAITHDATHVYFTDRGTPGSSNGKVMRFRKW